MIDRPSNLIQLLVYAVLAFFTVITLVPLVWLLVGAFKTNEDFFGYLFFPLKEGGLAIDWARLTLENFRGLFFSLNFGNYIANSFFLASVTSVLATLFAAMGGYALAKFQFTGRQLMLGVVLFAIIIPAPLLLAPVFQLIYQLNLLNTYTGLILPAMAPAFGIFLFRQAMLNSVPTELLEAARIDGCGEGRIFLTIVLPIVRPMVGAFLLITFLGTWNNFIMPQVLLQSEEMFPLSVAIAQLRGTYSTDYGMISAGTVISIAPVMCLFLLLQREFISGLTSGAVKG